MSGTRIGREDVERFLDLVRSRDRRLDPRFLGPEVSGLDWPAVHRLVGRLERAGYVRRDRWNLRRLERRIDREPEKALELLVDPRGRDWADLAEDGWRVAEKGGAG